MAISIGELAGTISLNDQFSGPINKVAKALGVSSESFRAVTGFAGGAAAAIVGATAAIVALGVRGAAVADVRGAFDNLTTAAGSSADVMLGALRSGTLGTISDFDLMSKANGVLGSGMVKSADDMKTLAAGAKLLADRTGGDTATAFDTLTGAMASGRTASLKQLGLFVDTDEAVKKYAASLGKSVKDLSDTEIAQVKSAAALAALKGQLDAAGPATADFGDQIDRGKVAVQNFTDNLSVAIATSPVVAAGMDAISAGIQAAFGGSQASMVETLMGFVNQFAIGLTYVAQVAVVTAGGFVQAWYLMKTVVLGVITAVSGFTTILVAAVAGIAEMAAKVPGAAAVVGDLAGGAAALKEQMEAVTQSLAAETAEAARGAAGHSELQGKLDAVGGAVLLVRDAMEAAADSTGKMIEKGAGLPKPIADIGAAATLTAAQIKAMEDQTNASMAAQAESMTNAATLEMTLMNQIAALRTSGIQQKLVEIEQARLAEIAGIQNLAFEEMAVYEARVALINEKYGLIVGIATGANLTIAQSASAAGFQTRAALAHTADQARELWADMVASGQFSAEEIRKAHQKAEEAKRAVTGATTMSAVQQFDIIANSASSVLRSVFGKNKLANIAAIGIDTAAAIVKTFAQFGWPFGLIPAAAMAAAALVQMNKVRTADPGFAQGTPDTRFLDFGRVSTVDLHGPEAIVTPKQGAGLADMVEESLGTRDARTEAGLNRVVEALERQEERARLLPLLLRDAVLLANA